MANPLGVAECGEGHCLVEYGAEESCKVAHAVRRGRNIDVVIALCPKCAAMLDQRRSPARVTSFARTGLSAT